MELISYLFSQELEIKKMAKTGNKEACKVLAKQLVQLRKQKNRTYAVSSKVTSMSTQTKVMNSQMKMAGAMSATAKVRQDVLFYSNAAYGCKNCVILGNCRAKTHRGGEDTVGKQFGFILKHFLFGQSIHIAPAYFLGLDICQMFT